MYLFPKTRIRSHAFNISRSIVVSDHTVHSLSVPCCIHVYLTETSQYHRKFSSIFTPVVSNKQEFGCYIYRKNSFVSKSATMSNSKHSPLFRLSDYDCIGFDLDNTLCEYKISSAVKMEYEVLAKFLVNEKGYDSQYLLKSFDESSIDFLQKGLLVDFARGNLLKIGKNGIICKASHGSRFMTEKEIIDAYGECRKWEVTSEFCKNVLVGWNGPLSEKTRALLDYFDMPASLAFARIIDCLDYNLGRPSDMYHVWPDVLAGLHNMYKREHFSENIGGYFPEIKSNPQRFIKKCTPDVIEWLKKIKEFKVLFLITGSNCDFAALTAEASLGKNWRSLFDIVICYARKPGFFSSCRPFIELDGFKETNPVHGKDLEFGKMYSQGNWQELYQLFGSKLGKKEPRCLYFGHNLIQDVFTPSEYTKCDTVAVVKELSVENISKPYGDTKRHHSKEVISSQSWGSYFFNDTEDLSTMWGSVINKYSKVCIPTLSVLAQYSINHEFTTFSEGPRDGYFPVSPDISAVKKKVNLV